MANNYYDMTGVLVLDKVTPVIKALFGAYELDANHPGNGEAYIANICESSNCTWDSVLENLQELVNELGLIQESDDVPEAVEDALVLLAKHFGAEQDETLFQLISRQDLREGDADIDILFAIAKVFNDGHGLKAIKTEAAWHCDKPRLFQFGGYGSFTGHHVSTASSSSEALILGEKLEQALSDDQLDAAADAALQYVNSLLSGIHDEASRAQVRAKLGQLLAVDQQATTDAAEAFEGYIQIEGARIDVSFEAPTSASVAEKDAAFMAALAQKAEVNYLAIGSL